MTTGCRLQPAPGCRDKSLAFENLPGLVRLQEFRKIACRPFIALGGKLFHDKRFSSTGEVSCATCHAREKGFTDQLRVSEGINKLTGTRSAPTVINAAYMKRQFRDGCEPDLEGQSTQPFLSGGIRPLDLSDQEQSNLAAFLKASTSPEYAQPAGDVEKGAHQ